MPESKPVPTPNIYALQPISIQYLINKMIFVLVNFKKYTIWIKYYFLKSYT